MLVAVLSNYMVDMDWLLSGEFNLRSFDGLNHFFFPYVSLTPHSMVLMSAFRWTKPILFFPYVSFDPTFNGPDVSIYAPFYVRFN